MAERPVLSASGPSLTQHGLVFLILIVFGIEKYFDGGYDIIFIRVSVPKIQDMDAYYLDIRYFVSRDIV